MAFCFVCICDMRSGTFLVVSVGTAVNPRGPRRSVPYVSHAAFTGSMGIPKSVPGNNSTTKSYCDLVKAHTARLWWQKQMLCHNVYFWHLMWYDSKLAFCFRGIKGISSLGHITMVLDVNDSVFPLGSRSIVTPVTYLSGWNTHTVLRTPAIGVLYRYWWIPFNFLMWIGF